MALALPFLGGCTHLGAQLITHAPEIAAYGGAAAAVGAGLNVLNQADELAHRVEKRAD